MLPQKGMECGYACYAVVPVPLEKRRKQYERYDKRKDSSTDSRFCGTAGAGKSFSALLQCGRQYHCRQICGNRGAGSSRQQQSPDDLCDSIYQRYVYGRLHSYGNAVRSRENGAFAKANQHHYDRRLCIFSGTFHVVYCRGSLAFTADTGTGRIDSAGVPVSSDCVCRSGFYLYL